MSLLAEFNMTVAGWLPAGIWDWLQIVFGLAVLFGSIFQRAQSDRFQKSSARCTGDSITIFLGQIALAAVGGLAFLVALDGFLPQQAPPRTFVVLFLAFYSLIQIRIIYQTISGNLDRVRRLMD